MKKQLAMILTLVLSVSGAFAAETYTASTAPLDVEGGYMQLTEYGGFKSGAYMDVQTRTSSFAYWGLLRWDLNTVKDELNDNLGGLGNWKVTKIDLTMYRTSYSYSASGNVDVRFTTDDTSNYTLMSNVSDGYSDPIGDQLVYGVDPNGASDMDGTFLKTVYYENSGTNYVPLTYTLYDAATDANRMSGGQAMMLDDIVADTATTLCFVDNAADYTVSAAWAGPDTTYYGQQPVLTITAEATDHVAVCESRPQFDVSGPEGTQDCKVDLYDFVEFAAEWLTCGYADPADCLK